jgi:hypothetical protein
MVRGGLKTSVIEHHPTEELTVYRQGAITTNPRVNDFLNKIASHPHMSY